MYVHCYLIKNIYVNNIDNKNKYKMCTSGILIFYDEVPKTKVMDENPLSTKPWFGIQ